MTTRTTKIPLRQSSSPTPRERSSGRGSRCQPETGKTKRSGTPVRGKNRSRSRSRRQSVTDLDIVVLGDDGDSDEWTGRNKSPRKKRASSIGRGRGRSASVDPDGTETASNGKRAGQAEFEIHQDEDDGRIGGDEPEEPSAESPELRQIDLNRVSVRPRSQSTKQKDELEQAQERRPTTSITARSPPKPTQLSSRKVSANSAMSYPTPSPTSSYHGDSDDVEKGPHPQQLDEGFDTMLESEGFTMIDLDSVPSARHFLSTPADSQDTGSVGAPTSKTNPEISKESEGQRQQQQSAPPVKPSPIPKYLATVDEETELSSNVPSSPPAVDSSMLQIPHRPSSGIRKVTPLQCSSPKLPSPPRPARKSPRSHQRTMSKEAVSAGMALQDIVSPEKGHSPKLSDPSSQKTPSSIEEELYDGFSSGTKRELRAGLRFGEELAKRQKPSPLNPAAATQQSFAAPALSKNKPDTNQTRPSTSTEVWRGEALVRHSSPLASNGRMQTKTGTLDSPGAGMFNMPLSKIQTTKAMRSSTTSRTETPKSSSQNIEAGALDTDVRRQHEWQMEREAVAREIESASPSKVVVIDSDDDALESEGARNVARKHSKAHKEELRGKAETSKQEERMEEKTDPSGQRGSQDRHQGEEADSIRGIGQEGMGGLHRDQAGDVDDDIWLEEAKAGSSSPREVIVDDLFTGSEQQRQRQRAVEVLSKPRRGLLPSPWKRGEDVEASTFMSNGETSGMFWQEPQSTGFGAGDIVHTKRKLSGGANFDLHRMLSSPVKYAKPGRKASMELKIDRLNQDRTESEQASEDTEREVENEEESVEGNAQDDTSESFESEQSVPSSPPQPTRVAVKFNDSTLSHDVTPPPLTRSTPTEDTDERPPTPRSAMKGTRQSFSPIPPQESPRKVVFSHRSLYLNDDGVESSMSAKLDSPQVEQPHPLYGQQEELEETEEVEEGEEPRKSGWMGWLWKGKLADDSKQNDTTMASDATPQLDGIHDEPETEQREEQWEPTTTAMTSGPATTQPEPSQSNLQSKPKLEPKKQLPAGIPSYLKPPSYPSDPKRSPTTPLATSGNFTNSHFRTLHIIYAKSQRPRFHAPKHIRAVVKALLEWKMELDLSKENMDVFEWQVGEKECEVLERFMQEVEWSHCVQAEFVGAGTGAETGAGVMKAMKEIQWAWNVEELARHLGMLVIGEIVRGEEGKR